MKKVRGVRFSQEDEHLISAFLKKNPYLDFSMLVRLSIMKFIEAPEIKLVPVKSSTLSSKENSHVRDSQSTN